MTAGSGRGRPPTPADNFRREPLQTVGVSQDLVVDEDSLAGRRRVIPAATLTVPPKQSPSLNTTAAVQADPGQRQAGICGRLSTNSNPETDALSRLWEEVEEGDRGGRPGAVGQSGPLQAASARNTVTSST